MCTGSTAASASTLPFGDDDGGDARAEAEAAAQRLTQELVDEIVKHVLLLRLLCTHFLDPFTAAASARASDAAACRSLARLSHAAQLIRENRAQLGAAVKHAAKAGSNLSDPLSAHLSSIALYDMYLAEYDVAVAWAGGPARRRRACAEVLADGERAVAAATTDATDSSFESLVIRPVQHLLRYPELIRQIAEAVRRKGDRDESARLDGIAERAREQCMECNESQRRAEGVGNVVKVAAELGLQSLPQPCRTLIKREPLLRVRRSGELAAAELFLFSDCVLLWKVRRGVFARKYVLIPILDLQLAMLDVVAAGEQGRSGLRLVAAAGGPSASPPPAREEWRPRRRSMSRSPVRGEDLLLLCDSLQRRQRWVESIVKQAHALSRPQLRSCSEPSPVVVSARPVPSTPQRSMPQAAAVRSLPPRPTPPARPPPSPPPCAVLRALDEVFGESACESDTHCTSDARADANVTSGPVTTLSASSCTLATSSDCPSPTQAPAGDSLPYGTDSDAFAPAAVSSPWRRGSAPASPARADPWQSRPPSDPWMQAGAQPDPWAAGAGSSAGAATPPRAQPDPWEAVSPPDPARAAGSAGSATPTRPHSDPWMAASDPAGSAGSATPSRPHSDPWMAAGSAGAATPPRAQPDPWEAVSPPPGSAGTATPSRPHSDPWMAASGGADPSGGAGSASPPRPQPASLQADPWMAASPQPTGAGPPGSAGSASPPRVASGCSGESGGDGPASPPPALLGSPEPPTLASPASGGALEQQPADPLRDIWMSALEQGSAAGRRSPRSLACDTVLPPTPRGESV